MAVRMVSAIARTIPTVADFSAMCPLLVPGCRIFIGNNGRRCVSYFTLRWLSKKCNFEPRASVSSVDDRQPPSHGLRCGHQYDRGCEHLNRIIDGSASAHVMVARMVNAIP